MGAAASVGEDAEGMASALRGSCGNDEFRATFVKAMNEIMEEKKIQGFEFEDNPSSDPNNPNSIKCRINGEEVDVTTREGVNMVKAALRDVIDDDNVYQSVVKNMQEQAFDAMSDEEKVRLKNANDSKSQSTERVKNRVDVGKRGGDDHPNDIQPNDPNNPQDVAFAQNLKESSESWGMKKLKKLGWGLVLSSITAGFLIGISATWASLESGCFLQVVNKNGVWVSISQLSDKTCKLPPNIKDICIECYNDAMNKVMGPDDSSPNTVATITSIANCNTCTNVKITSNKYRVAKIKYKWYDGFTALVAATGHIIDGLGNIVLAPLEMLSKVLSYVAIGFGILAGVYILVWFFRKFGGLFKGKDKGKKKGKD